MKEINPYEPNHPEQQASAVEARPLKPTRRFRWFVIPATFSWVFGVTAIVGIPIGIYQNPRLYRIDADRMMFYAAVAMPIALFVAGVFNILAGSRWLKSRWVWALIYNGLAYGTMMISKIISDVAFEAARRL